MGHSITITHAAAVQINAYTDKAKAIGARLLFNDNSGCSGYRLNIGLAQDYNPNADLRVEYEGAVLLVSRENLEVLKGTEIDFVQKGVNKVFEFRVPETDECGCGETFAPKKSDDNVKEQQFPTVVYRS